MKPRTKKRLTVARETLRTLWSDVLDSVHGGAGTTPITSGNCNSGICSIGRDCQSLGCGTGDSR